MLIADFTLADGQPVACAVSGHAEYTEENPAGQILCASVSSAVQLTCNTLTECFGADVEICEQPDAGSQNQLSFRLRKPDAVQIQMMQGLLIHFQALSEDFAGLMTVQFREMH